MSRGLSQQQLKIIETLEDHEKNIDDEWPGQGMSVKDIAKVLYPDSLHSRGYRQLLDDSKEHSINRALLNLEKRKLVYRTRFGMKPTHWRIGLHDEGKTIDMRHYTIQCPRCRYLFKIKRPW